MTGGRIDTFSFSMLDLLDHGAVAQLGERLNGIQEADGSIPFSSTILFVFEHRLESSIKALQDVLHRKTPPKKIIFDFQLPRNLCTQGLI